MDYDGLVKRLHVPVGFTPPTRLSHDGLHAEAITRDHLADDVAGINASLDLIRRTRGGSWPTEAVTEEFNYVDLVWHECEARELSSFTYVLFDDGHAYLGCAYFYPLGMRTPLSEELLRHDVDVSWWVTPDAHERGFYTLAYEALRSWAATAFGFTDPHFSNIDIPDVRQ